jgi:hypothetical protein
LKKRQKNIYAGTTLSFASVAIIIAFVQVWWDKGLIDEIFILMQRSGK